MKYLEGIELEEAKRWMDIAIKEAEKSPCAKAKCGVVIVKKSKLLGKGFNSPPKGFKCEPEYCKPICSTYAVHAEMNAIFNALKNKQDIEGATMYHVRVEEETSQDSRKPRCPNCSKHILELGIKDFVLKHEEGYVSYDSKEFHKLSLESIFQQ